MRDRVDVPDVDAVRPRLTLLERLRRARIDHAALDELGRLVDVPEGDIVEGQCGQCLCLYGHVVPVTAVRQQDVDVAILRRLDPVDHRLPQLARMIGEAVHLGIDIVEVQRLRRILENPVHIRTPVEAQQRRVRLDPIMLTRDDHHMRRRNRPEQIVQLLQILIHRLTVKQIPRDEQAVHIRFPTPLDDTTKRRPDIIGTIPAPRLIRIRHHPPVHIRNMNKTHDSSPVKSS